ncbi:MAG TPA: sigma-70 family RNA polymerase sigma factor, partial [Planctomycetota bacterium]|nr:sigma-70 family RNA polymerase sigma factor [Planctomycetota bacterium]
PRDLFEILVREHSGMLRAFLLSAVRDPGTVEDLFQETFLVAWRNLHRYDRQLPFGPWVRGIATKLMLNWRRRLGRQKVTFCAEQDLQLLDRTFERMQTLPGDTFDEKLDVLRACMTSLTGAQREAIALHYEHGLHCKEIAERLGISFEAVKKHLQRGRAALFRCMQGSLPPDVLPSPAWQGGMS